MDGITLAAQCKRYFPNMRVVIMSACSDKVIPAMGSAVDAFVQKPFSPKALVTKVVEVLQRSGRSGS